MLFRSEEISSLSHSVVFLYFFALIAEEGFFISSCERFIMSDSNARWEVKNQREGVEACVWRRLVITRLLSDNSWHQPSDWKT